MAKMQVRAQPDRLEFAARNKYGGASPRLVGEALNHDKEIAVLNKKAQDYAQDIDAIVGEIKKVIVGQKDVIDRIVIALISDGNVLLEGMPGLAKTIMIKTLADTLDASFKRIQFTPDLLPADIVGTKIYNHSTGSFATKKGPVFSNFILADEINRAPPKVQSALLEAMQEKQVTISGETFPLDKPFLVLATQNPIETEGTYRLPEAQLDRFMFKVFVNYPTKEDEMEIINRMTSSDVPSAKKTTPPEKILEMQAFVRRVYCDEKIAHYVTSIVHATRNTKDNMVEYGASPRASIWMIMGAKAHAVINGRGYVIPEDVKAVAHDVLRHRIMMTYEAEAEGVTSEQIIDGILKSVKVP